LGAGGDGIEVIKYARAIGYRGLIIAISGGDNQPLVEAGADAQVQKTSAAIYLCEKLA
jgi:D-arabinose 1-dehydrogenase-like Zn-dependent alcohol dehydrogenase